MRKPASFILLKSFFCELSKVSVFLYIYYEVKEFRSFSRQRFLVAFSHILKRLSRFLRDAYVDSIFCGRHIC